MAKLRLLGGLEDDTTALTACYVNFPPRIKRPDAETKSANKEVDTLRPLLLQRNPLSNDEMA
jgi:hypothetical protein